MSRFLNNVIRSMCGVFMPKRVNNNNDTIGSIYDSKKRHLQNLI